MWNKERLYHRLCREVPGLELRREEPMSRHTSFRIGGPAALMALPATEAQCVAAVKVAKEEEVDPMWVGNGSNLLVDDNGLDAFVMKTVPQMNEYATRDGVVTAGAGILLVNLANAAAECGLSGLEFAHGIPGSLGGAVTMNAGAYDGEMKQIIRSVKVLDRNGQIKWISAEDCDFSYRHSAFSDGKYLILGAEMNLDPAEKELIKGKMAELMARRREKQPLEFASAGSTFKRPEGHFAAALIDGCGLKGLSVGGAAVSEKHAGFVINRGNATCSDVLKLIEQVRERVWKATGVTLETEVKYLR